MSTPWELVETAPDAARAALNETLYALGNGRIGVRGAHEEGACWPGTEQDAIYINGYYDTEDIHYAENAYGFARQNQFIVSVPNGKAIRWRIGEEWFDPTQGRIEEYRRRLDFRTGVLAREFVWVSPQGRRVAVASRRVVCLARPLVYAIEYELRALDAAAQFVIEATIDARSRSVAASDDPRVGSTSAAQALEPLGVRRDGERIHLLHQTRRNKLQLASAVEMDLQAPPDARVAAEDCGDDDNPGRRYSVYADGVGQRVRLVKYCALVTSLDTLEGAAPTTPSAPTLAELDATASEQLAQAARAGFDALCEEQGSELARFWHDADVRIDGDDALQQGLRFNLLHLLQSAGRDGRSNIAAKGVTGSGYDGHYFWDTEIYVLPALLHTRPHIARRLLEFRFHTLDAARARARELNHPRGALFPWRTIAGAECSSYFPAGTAQYHINADIAFAVKRYWEATGDHEFIVRHGAELVFETARIWLDLGHFDRQRFVIHTVTGPDEYTALVDNNLYTNAMARAHLQFANELHAWLDGQMPAALRDLAAIIGLADDEPARWRLAAMQMYLPYDEARGIHPQDDSFLSKPRWETAAMDPARHPLLLHYHPLVIYRHQVCKQADVLLAMMLLDDQFDVEDKRRNFDYYEPITTHDSSLSRCIHGIVATEVGYHDKAYRYFVEGARTDLDDLQQNTRHGVHTAAMAGAWLGVVAGFAGLRVRRGLPTFVPHLPDAWTGYAFKLRFGEAQLEVRVRRDDTRYRLLRGESLQLHHHGLLVELSTASPLATFPTRSRD